MEEQLAELKQQRQGAAALAALWGMGCAQLRAATDLLFGATYGRPVSLAGGARCRRQRVCICYCIAEAAVGYALGGEHARDFRSYTRVAPPSAKKR